MAMKCLCRTTNRRGFPEMKFYPVTFPPPHKEGEVTATGISCLKTMTCYLSKRIVDASDASPRVVVNREGTLGLAPEALLHRAFKARFIRMGVHRSMLAD